MEGLMQTDEGKQLLRMLLEKLDSEDTPRKQLYTVHEAAKLLNRATGTVYDWIRLERVGCVRRGRRVFIPHDELERLRDSHCELLPPNPDKVPTSLKPKYSQSQAVAS